MLTSLQTPHQETVSTQAEVRQKSEVRSQNPGRGNEQGESTLLINDIHLDYYRKSITMKRHRFLWEIGETRESLLLEDDYCNSVVSYRPNINSFK